MKEREVISVTRIMIVTMPLLLVAAFVSCSRQAEDDDAPAPVRPAKIIEIQDPSAALERVFPGVVVPTDSTMLAFRVGGWLESLPVVDRVGAMVEAGDLLAALDPTDFQNSLDSAEASFQLAEQQYKRALKLLKEDVMSETEHDRLRARYRSKEAELKQAQTNLSYTRLHAPFRGRVARVIVRNYETVRAEEPIAVLEDAEKIDVEIQVPTAVMARISPGVKATFRAGKSEVQVYEIEFESEPGERYPASISESETQPDPATLTYRTIVSMPTPEGLEVLAGTNAKVHVDGSRLLPGRRPGGGRRRLRLAGRSRVHGDPPPARIGRADPAVRNSDQRRPRAGGPHRGLGSALSHRWDRSEGASPRAGTLMKIASFFMENRLIASLLTLLLFFGGLQAFQALPRLEDPDFVIKEAMVITRYPGASPEQVEQEVTFPIENAIQQLATVDYVTSISSTGLSQITVKMGNQYGPDELPQIWDELRRKVGDLNGTFPPGVHAPWVNDDYGDVFGLMITVFGDGYAYSDLRDYVDFLTRELTLVDGVGKVVLAGHQAEQVFVELSMHKLGALGIPVSRFYDLLAAQNSVSNAGGLMMGSEFIRFHPTGEFDDVEELGDLIVSLPGEKQLIHLRDVATIRRGYQEIPNNIYLQDGRKAIALGVSFASGSNVVEVGGAIEGRLRELEYERPWGLETVIFYNQPAQVVEAIDAFLISLAQGCAPPFSWAVCCWSRSSDPSSSSTCRDWSCSASRWAHWSSPWGCW